MKKPGGASDGLAGCALPCRTIPAVGGVQVGRFPVGLDTMTLQLSSTSSLAHCSARGLLKPRSYSVAKPWQGSTDDRDAGAAARNAGPRRNTGLRRMHTGAPRCLPLSRDLDLIINLCKSLARQRAKPFAILTNVRQLPQGLNLGQVVDEQVCVFGRMQRWERRHDIDETVCIHAQQAAFDSCLEQAPVHPSCPKSSLREPLLGKDLVVLHDALAVRELAAADEEHAGCRGDLKL
mmetsp:Transcript_10504/g.26241  ORF Transcript_10504/g.26241 Transcript_10504/m.26241 type:complete len:235 (+) Transcript_10504:72-776(+)